MPALTIRAARWLKRRAAIVRASGGDATLMG
jgi:hypothetical protein